ncbi:hypothetical protein, partial [Bartonella sp. AA16SXTY]|uniref:hypothetical protein n=1 Tax=Bartonella sp. AA16SXTY TaxID=3243429 RepID=UPI0035CFAC33
MMGRNIDHPYHASIQKNLAPNKPSHLADVLRTDLPREALFQKPLSHLISAPLDAHMLLIRNSFQHPACMKSY